MLFYGSNSFCRLIIPRTSKFSLLLHREREIVAVQASGADLAFRRKVAKRVRYAQRRYIAVYPDYATAIDSAAVEIALGTAKSGRTNQSAEQLFPGSAPNDETPG